jgi:hypothetical protein
MGGYVGIQPFFYDVSDKQIITLTTEMKETSTDAFQKLVEAMGCPAP